MTFAHWLMRFFHLSVNEYVRGLLKYFLDSATLLI